MPTLLACTDGSVYASSIYDHAAWAATRLAADIRVLHMIEPPPMPVPVDASGAIGIGAQGELLAELVSLAEAQGRVAQARARVVLEEAQRHLTAAGISRIAIEQQHGALVDAVEQLDARSDLIVIGKRGEHADFAKLHLGSNLERVIRSCRHPVLVASRAFKPIQRFLIAFDGGPSAMKAVAYAATQPLLKGLDCHLITAGSGRPAVSAELAAAERQLQESGYTVSTSQPPGDPETVIAEAVARHGIDLLVMGAFGHSRIRQFIVGSTTTTMVRTVQIPVLLFR